MFQLCRALVYILTLNDSLGGAPPLVGETYITFGALIFIDSGRIKDETVIFGDLVNDHEGVFGAVLGHAETALETFIGIYPVSHGNLQVFVL